MRPRRQALEFRGAQFRKAVTRRGPLYRFHGPSASRRDSVLECHSERELIIIGRERRQREDVFRNARQLVRVFIDRDQAFGGNVRLLGIGNDDADQSPPADPHPHEPAAIVAVALIGRQIVELAKYRDRQRDTQQFHRGEYSVFELSRKGPPALVANEPRAALRHFPAGTADSRGN